MTMRTRRHGVVIAGSLVLAGGPGFAQTIPDTIPGPSDPTRIEQRFEQPPAPQSVPEPELPAPEQAPPPEQAETIRFGLADVALEGATVFPMEELKPLWADLLGRDVSLAQIYDLRDRITALYRNEGYVLSQAVIPAQRIRGGVVRLEVVEGYIDKVIFEGDYTDRLGLLEEMAEKIKASRPLRMKVMERYVMLADDLPGMTVRTVLEASPDAPGGSDLTFTMERAPFNGSLSADNRGTRSIGRMQFVSAATAEDQYGAFDRTVVQGIVAQEAEELRYVDVAHTLPITSEGTTLTFGARRSWSEPGAEVKPLDLDSLTTGVRVGVSHPFLRSRSQTLRADLGFTARQSRSTILSRPQSEDRLRVLSASLSYDIADGWEGSNIVQATVSKGLDVLGATRTGTPGLTREGGRSDFIKYNLVLQRNQPVTDQLVLVAAAEGQYSPDRLLSSEEFGVGGKTYGRAFDGSEISGDLGASGRLEAMLSLPPWQEEWLNHSQVYGFTDYGWIWNHETGTRHGRQALASYGAGLRFGLLERLDGSVELAFPMLRDASATNDRGPRVFFSLSSRF